MAYGEQGDLVVEMYKTLNDHSAATGTTSFLRDLPCRLHFRFVVYGRLAMTGRRHDGLDYTGNTDLFDGRDELIVIVGKFIPSCRQVQLFGCQTTDRFAVHGEECRIGRRDDVIAFLLQLYQSRRSDCLHFRDDERRMFRFDDLAQTLAIQHVEHIRTMCDLHSRGIFVPVTGDDLHAVALEFHRDFFT